VGDKYEVIGDRDGGEEEVIGADRGALGFQFGADTACKTTSAVVEGEAGEWLEKLFDKLAVAIGLLTFFGSVAEFGVDDRAKTDFAGGNGEEASFYWGWARIDQADAGVGV
jgi:hypothetical protein